MDEDMNPLYILGWPLGYVIGLNTLDNLIFVLTWLGEMVLFIIQKNIWEIFLITFCSPKI